MKGQVNNYHEATSAIKEIQKGNKKFEDYSCKSSLYDGRLRLAQSWTDRGINYLPKHIMGLNYQEAKEKLSKPPVKHKHRFVSVLDRFPYKKSIK